MMDSGGDGGLMMGPLKLDQYYILNADTPYPSRQAAEEAITRGFDIHSAITDANVKFEITESNNNFYIWYMPIKHTL